MWHVTFDQRNSEPPKQCADKIGFFGIEILSRWRPEPPIGFDQFLKETLPRLKQKGRDRSTQIYRMHQNEKEKRENRAFDQLWQVMVTHPSPGEGLQKKLDIKAG